MNNLTGNIYMVWGQKPEEPKPHIEYPKMVYLADGSHVIVHNAEEESVARGEDHPGDKEESTPEKPRRGRPPKAKE